MSNKRRIAVFSAAALLATTITTLTTPGSAWAHGALTSPSSRTHACFMDGTNGSGGGQIISKNPACAEAVATGGTQPLYDWFGVLRSDGGGRTAGYIPDGQLCSGGNTKYAAYDKPRADWPATSVRSGQTMDFVYGAWVPHPGSIRYFITKPGFDPAQPLKWSDLEVIASFEPQPPLVNEAYTGSVTLPARSGRHIVYALWWRSDSQETFYGCSDVDFGGGNNPPPTTTPAPPPATTTPAPPPVTTTAPPPGTGSCSASVSVVSAWSGGFQGEVTFRNTGTSARSTWSVTFTLPSGATFTSGWNGTFTQSGQQVTVRPAQWNGNVAAGSSVSVGFLGNATSSPTFTGTTCA